MNSLMQLVLPVALLSGSMLRAESAEKTVHQLAVARNIPEGAPKASDVIMRSLRAHPTSDKDPHDTLQALRDFHVTRLEWAYITDKAFIDKVKALGVTFGGAASAPSYFIHGNHEGWEKVCVVNLNGEIIIAPWKRSWKPTLWGCVNNPELERGYVEYLKRCLDAGAEVMQRDEPGGNQNATGWGGCFCEHCVAGFRKFLKRETTPEQREELKIGDVDTFDYADYLREHNAPVGDAFRGWNGGELKQLFVRFQTEATVAFHQRTRKALNEYAGRRVPFSCNNGVRQWGEVQLCFDWAFGELSYSHAAPDFLLNAAHDAVEHDRLQVVTMPKKSNYDHPQEWELLTCRTVAMSYAYGMFCMVPWDVYMPGDAPRYFGTSEQYADVFGFIRANAEYLDGYEEAAVAGAAQSGAPQGDAPPVSLSGAESVWAVTRAKPGQPDSPVVIHLIDWSDEPKPFAVHLDPRRLFGDRPLKLTLRTPTPYSKEAHEAAQRSGDYSTLCQAKQLPGGYVTRAKIPSLNPWALLIVEPDDSLPKGVWAPSVVADEGSYYRDILSVRMVSPSRGATMRYTTDGAEPTTASPAYEKPLTLRQTTTVKARAFVGGELSAVTTATFTKRDTAPAALAPDSPALRPALCLWLKADAIAAGLQDGAPVERWAAAVGPSAVARPVKLHDGKQGAPPMFVADALAGKPAVRFDGVDDHLSIEGFANKHLAATPFTVFLVTQSEDDVFGLCGNSLNGGGGIPRLYLTRTAFRYDVLDRPVSVHVPVGQPVVSVFMHDGDSTASAATNGKLAEPVGDLPVVVEFGGGNLAMPFWSGNRNHAGDIGEVIVYDRLLTSQEREGVEAYLSDKYGIRCQRRWQ